MGWHEEESIKKMRHGWSIGKACNFQLEDGKEGTACLPPTETSCGVSLSMPWHRFLHNPDNK